MKSVTVFGSAQPQPGSSAYEAARDLGRLLAQAGFAVDHLDTGLRFPAACGSVDEPAVNTLVGERLIVLLAEHLTAFDEDHGFFIDGIVGWKPALFEGLQHHLRVGQVRPLVLAISLPAVPTARGLMPLTGVPLQLLEEGLSVSDPLRYYRAKTS